MTITYAMTATLLITGLTLMLLDAAYKLKKSEHRFISMILIGTSIFYVLMDCLWIIVYTGDRFNRPAFVLFNFLFYLVYITLPYIWFLFAKHFAGSRLTSRRANVLFAVPWLFNLALVLLTMLGTDLLWIIGDSASRYTRGPLFSIFSNLNLVYYFIPVIGIIVLLITGRGADRRTLLTTLGFSVIPAAGVFIYTYWISVDAIYPFQPCCFFIGVMFAYILLLSQVYKKAEDENIRLAEEAKAAGKMAELMGSVAALLTNMPAMSFSKDTATGKYLACNQSFAEYAHKETPDDVVGLTDHEIFDPVTADHFVSDDKKAMEMNEPYIFFEDVPDAAGVLRHLQTTKLTFKDTSGRLCLLGMCVDVTEMTRMKAAEAESRARQQELEHRLALQDKLIEQSHALKDALASAQQANQAKTAFLSNMSHEIRTPMNAIIGLNNIALNDPQTPEKTRGYLERIGTSAQHLLGIINDILDMSRIESGRMDIKHERFDLEKTLDQVNTMISGQCRTKGLHYTYTIDPKSSRCLIGDDMKLRQVLINILGNAVKFTPEGGSICFDIEETAKLENKSTIRFKISDTGIGMSEDYLPHIFDAFSQESADHDAPLGSTGLGMPITKNIVELMNGHIEVESEKGAGSTFTVTITFDLPEDVSTDEAEKAGTTAVDDKDVKADLKGKRILLAEDMPVNAEIIMMVLGTRDMIVDHAENGRIAVDMFKAHEAGYYDAVLMDMRMPEMDGLTAARTIRAFDRADARTIPIIALTANAFDEDVERSMQAGLNAHLSKPVEPEVLFKTLEDLL